MKVWIESSHDTSKLVSELKKYGVKITESAPDFVISYGGNGTILQAEHRHSGTPIVALRESEDGSKCINMGLDKLRYIINALKNKKYEIIEEMKVKGVLKDKSLEGLNEVQIHNAHPNIALRFEITTPDWKAKVIGDGVIVSTPFGSTSYFKAVGGKPFVKGLGIALNNPFNVKRRTFVVDEKSKIKVKIMRGEGLMLADNIEIKKTIKLKPEDEIDIMKSERRARLVKVVV